MNEARRISSDGVFAGLRARLFSAAYRMLGTRADAEDVVQDAWLRWQAADHASLQSAEAWLVTVTTRLALDRLRERKAERESYTGWWLPEPLVELEENTPETAAELASDVSLALLWTLERLGAEERAALLLRQVFDQDYGDIAAMLGKSEASCRQLVHRAQEKVRDERPRFQASPEAHRALLAAFIQAASKGDRDAMAALLAPMRASSATAAASGLRSTASCAGRAALRAFIGRWRTRIPAGCNTGWRASTVNRDCCAM